jgi:hypothetical protein
MRKRGWLQSVPKLQQKILQTHRRLVALCSFSFAQATREASVLMGNRKNLKQHQHVDVDKNPNERPGESLYDKETRESQEKLEMAKKEKGGK